MRNIKSTILSTALVAIAGSYSAQCTGVGFTSLPDTIVQCGGDSVHIVAEGLGATTNAIDNNFNTGGAGLGWAASPAATFSNPCGVGPGGATSPYLWMGNTTAAPRTLETIPLDLTCGATLSFDFKMAQQGSASPCEGPDTNLEGIYVEWSNDGGVTWNLINYFEPDQFGSNTAACAACGDFTAWGSYSYLLPPAANTSATIVHWFQGGSSGNGFDHWGLDNIVISTTSCNEYWYDWSHVAGTPDSSYIDEFVEFNTTFDVMFTNGIDDTCTSSITILVDTLFDVTSTFTEEFCDEANDGSITVTPQGGYPAYSYTLTGPITPVTNNSGVFNNLPEGTYVSIVTGNTGCVGYDTVTLLEGLHLTGTLTTTDAPCFGDDGNIAFVPDTGINPFTYVLEQGSITVYNNTVPLILNQAFMSGTYHMVVSDGNGCIIDTNVTVNSPAQIVPSFTASTYEGVYPLPVNFTNTTTGATGYSWDFGDGGSSGDVNPSYVYNTPGDYNVVLTVQNGPCSGSASQLIVVINESSVVAPNVITTNGDGVNDLFKVDVNSIEEYRINIFNRWGRELFESTDPNESWDGTNKFGTKVSSGTYFYVIEATGYDAVVHKNSGHITVMDN